MGKNRITHLRQRSIRIHDHWERRSACLFHHVQRPNGSRCQHASYRSNPRSGGRPNLQLSRKTPKTLTKKLVTGNVATRQTPLNCVLLTVPPAAAGFSPRSTNASQLV